jgi:hypothetical protein
MTEICLMLMGGLFITAFGVLLIIASINPEKNSLTSFLYDLWTLFPGFGWKDQFAVLISGIGALIGGLAVLVGFIYELTKLLAR